jgi:hypothetical protein
MRCLDPDPASRPASVAELAHELAGTLPHADTIALPEHPTQRATQIRAAPVVHTSRRRLPPLLVAAAALVVAGVIAAVVTTQGGGGSATPPARPPVVAPLPHEPTALAQAQDLATWLKRYSG